ncbi:thymidine phosphorylase [Spiroplasma sp. TIUS-1]|uniref:thymidine phosphorylase n=1 Tax=Spiroplasma sp. TIUS-1 TaxID=216963 RepID=UPI001396FFDF|nr:thymidine phosphorylase [Spiroplasma sp. TIUS-1]QHX36007.1 thymidine phosphorylase [Spiroplasma sp. TIUS-1]
MNFVQVLNKKKQGLELTTEEINYFATEYAKGTIPDYQASALLMAICIKGLNEREILDLTQAYVSTGDKYMLENVKGYKVDKHSTGGVGDKTSLVYGPICASYGLKVCKMSGRGLAQTGGTIDKLETFPGMTTELSDKAFQDVINKTNMSIIQQTSNIVLADKKIYALRDVTGTVDSIGLITASIMSKKLVLNNDGLVIDCKVGKGAFMKDLKEAKELSNYMIKIGKMAGRDIAIMLTNMNTPLGKAIGNAIEVKEAYDTLLGNGPDDLNELCATAAAISLVQGGIFKDFKTAEKDVLTKLKNGDFVKPFKEFVEAQGGDFSVIENYDKNFTTKNKIEIKADKDGFIEYIDANEMGLLAMELGAGRKTKEDTLDLAAGIYLEKQTGDAVKKGDVLFTLYSNKVIDYKSEISDKLFTINKTKPNSKIILDILQ